ncbi:MAG: hypothetical protein II589_08215, partial [Clostridia bacterium]|nr:hypothetical protein [Clostridia bacterium]
NSDTDNSDTDNSDTDTEFFWQIGDVNMDHKITAKDSLLLQRGLLKLEKLSKAQFVLGEVNFDGRENNRDALEILRYTIKLHDENHIGEEIDISPYL